MTGFFFASLLTLGGCHLQHPTPVGVYVPWQNEPSRIVSAGGPKADDQSGGVIYELLIVEKASRDYAQRADADKSKIDALALQSKSVRLASNTGAMRASIQKMWNILNQGD